MSGEPFSLDTNVLVYAHDIASGAKHEVAKEIVTRSARLNCRLSLQAISEFYAVVTRKGLVSPPRAAEQIEDWLSIFPTAGASASAVRAALSHAVAGRASYWDALLIEALAEYGCTFLLSEDMADGSRIGGVTLVQPFTTTGLSPRAELLLQP